jgi:phospholipase A1
MKGYLLAVAVLVAAMGSACSWANDTDDPDSSEAQGGTVSTDGTSPPSHARLDGFQQDRTFWNRLTIHEPFYFIAGPDRPEVKFQFSIKYRLLNFGSSQGAENPHTLQLGYTQRSLWDVGGPSSPFYDTSYMPELMYQWRETATAPPSEENGLLWLGLQSGLRHESNGKDGAASRSLNVVYAQPMFSVGSPERWHVVFLPELWTYVGSLSDNPTLPRYRGYGQLRAVIGKGQGPSLLVTLIPGEHFEHGSRELDLSFPISVKSIDFSCYLLLQYFNGYGESLLDYNQHTSRLRVGFALVR